MAYIVDILIIILFAAIVFSSYRKGFFVSLFDLIGTFLALIAARALSVELAGQVFDNFIRATAENTLANSLGEVGTTDYALQAEQALNSIPDSLNGIMTFIGIDKQNILDKVSSANVSGDNLVETIMINVVEPIGTAVVQFVLFAVLALVLALAVKLIVKLLNLIIKSLPAVKQFNSALGVVFGIFRGLIVVVIISMIIGVVASFINNESVIEAVNNSFIITTVQNLVSTISGIAV